MAKYAYPAIFYQDEDGKYFIDFPDLEGCFTQGDDVCNGLEMAQDALSLWLVNLENRKEKIPQPTPIKNIVIANDGFTTMVSCDTTSYRKSIKSLSVKKTLTIPDWLNEAALEANINFSQVLQEALVQKLGLS